MSKILLFLTLSVVVALNIAGRYRAKQPPTNQMIQDASGAIIYKPEAYSIDSNMLWQTPALLSEIRDSIEILRKKIFRLELEKPFAPKNAALYDKGCIIVAIDFNPQDVPHLAGYENILLMLDTIKTPIYEADFLTDWPDANLKRNGKDDALVLTLIDTSINRTFCVYPIFTGENYAKAIRVFEKKLAQFQKRVQKLKKEKEHFELRYQILYNEWQNELKKLNVTTF